MAEFFLFSVIILFFVVAEWSYWRGVKDGQANPKLAKVKHL